MPAALEVDHTQVRLIAVQIGVRAAARELGLPEGTVLRWAAEEGWSKDVERAEAILSKRAEAQGVESVAINAVDVLKKYNGNTRLALAKGLLSGAEEVSRMDGQEVLISAQNIASLTKSAALVHDWNQGGASVTVNIAGLGDHITDCPSIDV